jgi:hypothetical protein
MILKNYKPQKLSKYEKIIFRSYCAEYTKFLVDNECEMYRILRKNSQKTLHTRKSLKKKMSNENISDKVYLARLNGDTAQIPAIPVLNKNIYNRPSKIIIIRKNFIALLHLQNTTQKARSKYRLQRRKGIMASDSLKST